MSSELVPIGCRVLCQFVFTVPHSVYIEYHLSLDPRRARAGLLKEHIKCQECESQDVRALNCRRLFDKPIDLTNPELFDATQLFKEFGSDEDIATYCQYTGCLKQYMDVQPHVLTSLSFKRVILDPGHKVNLRRLDSSIVHSRRYAYLCPLII
jgi:hypothetical protein